MTTEEKIELVNKELNKYRVMMITIVEEVFNDLRKQEEEFKNDSTRASEVSCKIGK